MLEKMIRGGIDIHDIKVGLAYIYILKINFLCRKL